MTGPDGLLGAILASESLGLTETMINGAGGCRSRAQIMLHELIQSYDEEDPGFCGSKYYSRQSRLPCTYLNNDDMVFGTMGKVSDGISSVSGISGRRVLLLDTLGASLVCTDYAGFEGGEDPIILSEDLSGMTLPEGFDAAACAVLSGHRLDGGEEGAVNLLGYGIADPGWEAGAECLRRILGAMGVRVNTPFCRPSHGDIASCGSAALNVMVRPEYCRRTAGMLRERYGTPFLRPSAGAPVGYAATRSLIVEIADALGLGPEPSLRMVDAEERAVRSVLMNFDMLPLGLHAKGLVIEGDSSTAYPLLKWMHGTFGMAPRSVRLNDSEYLPEISDYLGGAGYPEALGAGPEGDAEAVFTDGLTAMRGRMERTTTGFVEIGIPRGRHLDLMGRCVVGTAGCRYILDELFNTIRRFRCGQPTQVDYRPCCRNRGLHRGSDRVTLLSSRCSESGAEGPQGRCFPAVPRRNRFNRISPTGAPHAGSRGRR